MGDNVTRWQAILGPFPEGTILRFRDRRYKKGHVDGEVIGYFPYYYPYKDMKTKTYSYKVKVGDWRRARTVRYKRPSTVIKVLSGQKRKKE